MLHPAFCSGLALWLGFEGMATASTVTVGDPQHPADLPAALVAAHTAGAADITIAPGVYDLPSTISLSRWSDTVIHANGVTLVFGDPSHTPVVFEGCTRVTWDGGTIRYAHPAFTQGRIIAIASDANGPYLDWQIDAGYATEFERGRDLNIVDQKTRLLKVGTTDWTPKAIDALTPGRFRLHLSPAQAARFAVNDWLVARSPGGWSVIHIRNGNACTIQNVTLQNGGFATLFETGGAGANRYLKCRIEPGPRPPGATEDPLVADGADGFHSSATETGPDIEDCVFTGVFLDDCIAIHGGFSRVTQVDGATLTLASIYPLPQVHDTLRIADTHGFFAQGTCQAVERGAGDTVKVTLDQDLHVPIDHTQDDDKRLGTKASNPRYCGRGYKMLRCQLGHTRSRGILVKADDGLIEGCTIAGCGMSGVSIGPEFWWNEAGYNWNVTVTHNRFSQCEQNNDWQGTLFVHGDGAMGNRNISILENTFDRCYGTSIIHCDWTDGVQITGNEIAQPFPFEPRKPCYVIRLMNSKNIKLLDNRVVAPGSFAGDLVGIDPSVAPSEVTNNDAAGIKIVPESSHGN